MSSTAVSLRFITAQQADLMSPDVFEKELREAFRVGCQDGEAQAEDETANLATYDRDLAKAYEAGWSKGIGR